MLGRPLSAAVEPTADEILERALHDRAERRAEHRMKSGAGYECMHAEYLDTFSTDPVIRQAITRFRDAARFAGRDGTIEQTALESSAIADLLDLVVTLLMREAHGSQVSGRTDDWFDATMPDGWDEPGHPNYRSDDDLEADYQAAMSAIRAVRH